MNDVRGLAFNTAQHDLRGLRDLTRYVQLGGRPDLPYEDDVRTAAANVNDRRALYLHIARAAANENQFAWWWLFAYPPLANEALTTSDDYYTGKAISFLMWGLAGLLLSSYWGLIGVWAWIWFPFMIVSPVYFGTLKAWDYKNFLSFGGLDGFKIGRLISKASDCSKSGGAASLGTLQAQCLLYIEQTLAALEQAKAQAAMPETVSNVHGSARLARESEVDRLARGGS